MAIVSTKEAEAVMKRCQIGTNTHCSANDLHAECYGTIGALVQERNKLRLLLKELDPDKFKEMYDEKSYFG